MTEIETVKVRMFDLIVLKQQVENELTQLNQKLAELIKAEQEVKPTE
ncbi:MAG TPA: hypothetical protein VIJ25_11895 [Methylococcales bacterium]